MTARAEDSPPGGVDPPPRGRRPPGRRDMILRAAARLFTEKGYAQVTMADVASAVNVGGSALYRHFSGKSELLLEVLESGLSTFADALDTPGFPELLRALAEGAVDDPGLGTLWQREARNLDAGRREVVRARLNGISARLAHRVARARPELDPADSELVAWSILGVLVSISFHRERLPRADLVDLLTQLAAHASALTPERGIGPVTVTAALAPSTRAQILAAATRLFAERGFAAVGIDEIGEAVGIAGPSVYTHFESKQRILAEVATAGEQRLATVTAAVTDAAPSGAGEDAAQLRALIRSYVEFAAAERHFIRILLSEIGHLPPDARQHALDAQRDYVQRWVRLRQAVSADAHPEARIRTLAVILAVDDAVNTGDLRLRPDLPAWLCALGERLLLSDRRAGRP